MEGRRSLKRPACLLLCVLFLFCLSACGADPSPRTASVWAFDTLCSATVYGGPDSVQSPLEASLREGEGLLRAGTDGRRFAEADGQLLEFLSSEEAELIQTAWQISDWSDGAFDLTVAPLSALWDVSRATRPPAEEDIARALALVGYRTAECTAEGVCFSKAGQGLDLGAVAKGSAGDRAAERLQALGCTGGVLDLGGNIKLFGAKPDGSLFRVGIRDPRGDSALGILTLTDTSVITSGSYERYFEYEGVRYHHILDPRTGRPAESGLLSVTVVCKDGALADMLSTACFVLGAERGTALLDTVNASGRWPAAEGIFVLEDGGVVVTAGLEDAFSLTSKDYFRKEADP